MKVGIAVFAYNRSRHLYQVLEGLKLNEEVNEIYVFQDGLKNEHDRTEWTKTRQLIEQIDWCSTITHYEEENLGLANSIVKGIDTVFKDNDAIIVLEDDCVPAPSFIRFMKQCFEKYEKDEEIYSVSGFGWPVDLVREGTEDVFFCQRLSSWGWGTWKNRWSFYDRDYMIVNRLRATSGGSERLALWGNDLEDMLIGNIKGYIDSWAVFFDFLLIEKDKYSVNPYKSLIKNIGYDGSGVHCTKDSTYDVEVMVNKISNFQLPDKGEISEAVKEKFAHLLKGTRIEENDKEDVLIWGLGKFYHENEEFLIKKYHICGFVDTYKKGYYAGKKIFKLWELTDFLDKKIIVMIRSLSQYEQIVAQLIKLGYDEKRIVDGNSLWR